MRNKLYVLLASSMFWNTPASGQNYAVYNSYHVNQYLYNPAEVATEYAYIFVNHRQQWLGFEGAPTITTVNFNTLVNETHSGVGIKASSFKRGPLTTTDFLLSYAYGIPFKRQTALYFGMSAGAISNNIDITGMDLSDPAVANYMDNNIQPAGNVGMVLKTGSGFNLGVVLPQLFDPGFNSAQNFDIAFTPLDNIIISSYFRKKIEGKLVSRSKKGVKAKVKTSERYAPFELHALYKYAKYGTSQYEVMGKLNLSENFWLGAAYRQAYGLTGSLGFSFNKFLMSYSYEPGSQPQQGFSTGTHEIQLGLRLGEARKFKRETPVLRSTLRSASQQHSARFQHTEEDPDNIRNDQQVKKKYYVVIRSFTDFAAADSYKKKLIAEKYNGNVFYNEKDKTYYVYVFETGNAGEAHEEVRNLKAYTKLREARMLTVTIEE